MRARRVTIGICGIVLAAAALAAGAPVAHAQQPRVSFPSLDGATTLNAFLWGRPNPQQPRPALILLHGCGGLQRDGRILPVYRNWGRQLLAAGYIVLIVDSAGSRGFGATCTPGPARVTMMTDRPKDAYAALQFLQAQPSVRPDRIAVLGWSQGGATVLRAIRTMSVARPQPLEHDFRAAVAFYPGACNERLQSRPFVAAERGTWTTGIPLLVLFGSADNWTPAGPCEAFMAHAKARGAPVEFKLYPGALHVFDAPNLPRRALPDYRTEQGVVPLVGTDEAARADALVRVPEFLRRYLDD